MSILITNALRETIIVVVVLLFAIVASARRTKDHSFFSPQTTTELKGLAILMVVFSHIGYFLVSDHRFLVPLSNYAGLGVDLFLILSGYGLVAAALQRPVSIGKFYLKRLGRVYLPVLATVVFFLLLDFFFLHRAYPVKTILVIILGFFPQADVYGDLNSPLWYITPLLVYYFLFPIIFKSSERIGNLFTIPSERRKYLSIFWRRFPLLSAIAMVAIGWLIIGRILQLNIFSEVVLKLYKLHFLALPLGMAMGALINQSPVFIAKTASWFSGLLKKHHLAAILRWVLIVLAGSILVYNYYHPSVGEGWKKESAASLFSAIAIIALFLFKKIDFKILSIFGLFSFEIYLLHWPLLSRYNFLYGKIPAGMATFIYLALLLGIGYLYHKATKKFFRLTTSA